MGQYKVLQAQIKIWSCCKNLKFTTVYSSPCKQFSQKSLTITVTTVLVCQ